MGFLLVPSLCAQVMPGCQRFPARLGSPRVAGWLTKSWDEDGAESVAWPTSTTTRAVGSRRKQTISSSGSEYDERCRAIFIPTNQRRIPQPD